MNEYITKIPIYTIPHFIAYFDILGYKNEIINNENALLLKMHICMYSFHAIMQSTYTALKEFYLTNNEKINSINDILQYKIFSDNIIIFCPLINDPHWDNFMLYLILDACNNIQCNFCRIGIKLRGCVLKGNLYNNDDDFIFGTGLIKSVDLEKNAKVSRIIIDDDIFIPNIFNDEIPLIKDIDDIIFLDYLKYYYKQIHFLYEDKNNKNMISMLNSHIVLVNSIPKKSDEICKYIWLKNYHNNFCVNYQFQDFLINE